MPLKLRDITFGIAEATLTGWLNVGKRRLRDELQWAIKVQCDEKEIRDDVWEPVVSFEGLRWAANSWKDLEGKSYSWRGQPWMLEPGLTAAERRDRAPSLSFYVFEHGTMDWGDIKIGRRDGTTFDLTWKGVGDVHYPEPYGTNVPFEIECPMRFDGISVLGDGSQSEDELRGALAAQQNLEGLTQLPLQRRRITRGSVIMDTLSAIVPGLRNDDILTLEFKP